MKTTTDRDIISDIHRTREAIAAKFDHNVKALVADVISRQKLHGARLAPPPPKKPRP